MATYRYITVNEMRRLNAPQLRKAVKHLVSDLTTTFWMDHLDYLKHERSYSDVLNLWITWIAQIAQIEDNLYQWIGEAAVIAALKKLKVRFT
jgi:hypothetical protein